jgi:hypothetical protein
VARRDACAIGIHYIVGYDIAMHVGDPPPSYALSPSGSSWCDVPSCMNPPAVGVVDG